MNLSRDHHFIPVFYLKQWANTAGKLFEYSRPYNNKIVHKRVGPKATGFQRDLYSFNDCPPEIAQYLESVFLQRADHLASLALAKHLAGDQEPWTSELRSAWSRFTINFLIRHPDPYAEIKAVTRHGWQPDAQDYERLRQPDDPATIEEWIQLKGDNWGDRIRIRLMQTAMDNDAAGERFSAMAWNVLDLSGSDFPLLTSDWPLIRHIDGERMFFALPISPVALFSATNHQVLLENLQKMSPNRLAKRINTEIVSAARLYVYSADSTQEDFIKKHMSFAIQKPPFFPSLERAFAN